MAKRNYLLALSVCSLFSAQATEWADVPKQIAIQTIPVLCASVCVKIIDEVVEFKKRQLSVAALNHQTFELKNLAKLKDERNLVDQVAQKVKYLQEQKDATDDSELQNIYQKIKTIYRNVEKYFKDQAKD